MTRSTAAICSCSALAMHVAAVHSLALVAPPSNLAELLLANIPHYPRRPLAVLDTTNFHRWARETRDVWDVGQLGFGVELELELVLLREEDRGLLDHRGKGEGEKGDEGKEREKKPHVGGGSEVVEKSARR